MFCLNIGDTKETSNPMKLDNWEFYIVPTTIISLRVLHGSSNPTEVIPFCILATMCSSISGLLLDYFIRRKNGNY